MTNTMQNKNRKTARLATLFVVRVAFMSALLTALKFALSFVPNVEIVTLLILVYGSCFGIAYALPATLIFCAVEVAIYGVGSWTILYFIYWPLLALFSSLFLKGRRAWLALIFAIVGSALFGVLSAVSDTLLALPNLREQDVTKYFVAYYLRGLTFDGIHIGSNVAVVLLLYKPLCIACSRLMPHTVVIRGVPKKVANLPHYYSIEKDEQLID